jgi:(E)-4-hydroxy-3-methylbut-2-enyl-diphosphate synthase
MKVKKTRLIRLGSVEIGAGAPVSIQSMTNTDTKDIVSTVRQIRGLEKIGCEIIRVAVKDRGSALAIKGIKKDISIPLEADIHFDYRLAVLAAEAGADGIRLNPGNIHNPRHVKEVIAACRKSCIPVRIGANSGSLMARYRLPGKVSQASCMVKSVMDYLKPFEKTGFHDIIISLKASDVQTTISAYRKIALLCDYPLHLGVTATGQGLEAVIKSAIGIGTLLAEGIGDTIRVSLTGNPRQEITAARGILQALGLRRFFTEVISCPTCGRCQVDLEKIVRQVKQELTACALELKTKRLYSIAIMGCEVNGPGEARDADIGIAFGLGSGILFKKGKIVKKVSTKNAITELIRELKRN